MGLLALVSIGVTYLSIERPAKRAERRRAQDAEFAETLQFAADEQEARGLLVAELERSIPGAMAVVFSRNNSENRLDAAAGLRPASPLAEKVAGVAPSTCLAVRRRRRFERKSGDERLLECELCGAFAANSLCIRSLVGGEVIGSVLVGRDERPLGRPEQRRIETGMRTAAPVLANLRNLAIAETRAVTDALTGLANARAAAQDLDRMVAFALRSDTPVAAIMLDLDHFKRINDTSATRSATRPSPRSATCSAMRRGRGTRRPLRRRGVRGGAPPGHRHRRRGGDGRADPRRDPPDARARPDRPGHREPRRRLRPRARGRRRCAPAGGRPRPLLGEELGPHRVCVPADSDLSGLEATVEDQR